MWADDYPCLVSGLVEEKMILGMVSFGKRFN
jgi:hypothetical protein